MNTTDTTNTTGTVNARVRRAIARWGDVSVKVFAAGVLALVLFDIPFWWYWIFLAVLALSFVRPAWDREREPVPVAAPVVGRWLALNSPGTKVPAHGSRGYGQTYAIDILVPHVVEAAQGPHPKPRYGWGLPRRAEDYPCFGEHVLAVAEGVVVAAGGGQRDHRARDTWPGLVYMAIEGFFRQVGGWRFVFGNHVIIDHGDGVYSAYAHLRRNSLKVGVGDRVSAAHPLGEVGNSGNTSEPHLHFQLMDSPHPPAASGLPFSWTTTVLEPALVAPQYGLPSPTPPPTPGSPPNSHMFTARPLATPLAPLGPASSSPGVQVP
ncbi:M23 family metallopeptidase [Actinocorallia sp. A-T 12471]|uniref:M23 family metallopeptidase n=1 Tax=Actinocorallia sp. A-T 12471 TaxID=3089813 RepID=UPI0029CC31C2|nr:M23 family metallopeptidase [Actinocorallia sp. A-T 12471]MDX6739473.1 M23 family metallopeptidase [Actinocorallia sp. A-T 12471]